MRRYLTPFFLMLAVTVLGHQVWPLVKPHFAEIQAQLTLFSVYCHAHPLLSYSIYALTLCTILLAGVPLATGVMLLAGVTYQFWEAAALVTLARLLAAAVAFALVRYVFSPAEDTDTVRPRFLRKLEEYPLLGLFLARLAPIPDSVVNYTVAASPISQLDYVLVSLAGMIPFTLACVWMGHQLGNVSALMSLVS